MKCAVLGDRGMLGSAIVRVLRRGGHTAVFTRARLGFGPDPIAAELAGVKVVFCCAAHVGGIVANLRYPAEFLRDNLRIALDAVDIATLICAKLVVFGSSCMYPLHAPQPLRENYLLTGPFESTNEPYALAKITTIKLCEAYGKQYGLKWLAPIPCNLYGPGDNYDLETCHVLPALIRRFHEAKESGADTVTLWGSGKPRREFMHVDDCAMTALRLIENGVEGVVNVGVGYDQPISDTATIVREVIGYEGRIEWDLSMPDGVPSKLLGGGFGGLGGLYRPLKDGLRETYEAYKLTLSPQVL